MGYLIFFIFMFFVVSILLLLCFYFRLLFCEFDMDGKCVCFVMCGSMYIVCFVIRVWVLDDLIKNCMVCKIRFLLVNRKVL